MTVQPLNEEAMFHSARAILSPAQRADYLAEACGDNKALRKRVDDLLRIHDEEASLAGRPIALGATIEHERVSEQVGTTIGRYKLLEEIGEGGFGVVYMAEQQEPVRRMVAVKLIKPGMDSRQIIARFEAERQALALMDHTNIARVMDGGTTGPESGCPGRPYFVMELVRGTPITEYCDQNKLAPRERLELFLPVCQAVQHAHQKGIIHRDLKPTNVLITLHDGVPVPKVIDFGIAKATGQRLTDRTLFTDYAQMIGTPLYMSPEQAEMSGLDVDTRSDIYSLGVLLYELLTGSTPFNRERLQQAALDEIRRIIREEEPPTPSTRLSQSGKMLSSIAAQRNTEPASLSKAVKGDLDWIVMKCLEKDRNRRYETASSLATDIRRHLADEPVTACPPSAIYRLKKFVRRNKIAAAFVVLLIGSVAALVVSDIQTRNSERLARVESTRAQAVSTFLQKMIRSANPEEANDAEYTVRQLLNDFSSNFGAELTDQPEVEAEIRATMGRTYWRLGINDKAESHLKRALELRRRQFGLDHELVAESLIDYAWCLMSQGGRWPEAEVTATEALRIYRARGTTGSRVIQAYNVLQQTLVNSQQYHKARSVTEEAIFLARSSAVEYPELAVILTTSADLLDTQGRYAEAERVAREAVEVHRRLHGPRHVETAWGLQMLGRTLLNQRKLPEAEALLREALAIFQERFRGVNPDGAELYTFGFLKQVLEARGDREGAEAIDRQMLRDSSKISNTEICDAWNKLAGYYLEIKETDEAIRCYQHALELKPENAGLLTGLGTALLAKPDVDGAEAAFRRAIAIDPHSIEAYQQLAEILKTKEERDASLALLRKAIKANPNDADLQNVLGWELFEQKEYEKALGAFRRAIEIDATLIRAMVGLGHCQCYTGDLAAGIATYRRALALNPWKDWILSPLGYALHESGDHEGAIAELQKSTEYNVFEKADHFTIAFLLDRTGRLDEGRAKRQANARFLEALPPAERLAFADALARKADDSLSRRGFPLAEMLARECLNIREAEAPDHWKVFDARSLLGASLLGQQKFADAEPLLVSGYEGLKQRDSDIPQAGRKSLKEALERLVELYTATQQPEKVAPWKEQLAQLDSAKAAKSPSGDKP